MPPQGAPDFDAWYEQEHVPMLMENPDRLTVRRFEVTDGVPRTYTRLALHYLANEPVLSAPERERARGTAWRKRLAENPWFKGTYATFNRHRQRQVGPDRS